MAKKQNEKLDYGALIKELRETGAERLYLLWGEEDYLREQFVQELRGICLEDGSESFNHRRFSSESFDLNSFREAVDAMPFFGNKTLIEVRDFDINKSREDVVKELQTLLSDIPEYCTVVFTLGAGYEPDRRLSSFKLFAKLGRVVEFTAQGQGALLNWILRRFSAAGKNIGRQEAEYLIFNCGSLMNKLILEIDKVSSYSTGESITKKDIDAVTTRTPEANVFNMTDCIASRDFDGAALILSELFEMREGPIMLLAIIGQQMRRLHAARTAIDCGMGVKYVMEVCEQRYDFIAQKLINAARRFEPEALSRAVELCADTDYAMKSSGGDNVELLKELLLRLAVGDVTT